jgi:hypothetical protein
VFNILSILALYDDKLLGMVNVNSNVINYCSGILNLSGTGEIVGVHWNCVYSYL